jgi:hypothetical protein
VNVSVSPEPLWEVSPPGIARAGLTWLLDQFTG